MMSGKSTIAKLPYNKCPAIWQMCSKTVTLEMITISFLPNHYVGTYILSANGIKLH